MKRYYIRPLLDYIAVFLFNYLILDNSYTIWCQKLKMLNTLSKPTDYALYTRHFVYPKAESVRLRGEEGKGRTEPPSQARKEDGVAKAELFFITYFFLFQQLLPDTASTSATDWLPLQRLRLPAIAMYLYNTCTWFPILLITGLLISPQFPKSL